MAPTNDTLQTFDQRFVTSVDDLIQGTLINNLLDADNEPVQVIITNDSPYGTVTANPDGTFEFLPSQGFIGTTQFRFVADDGIAQSNESTVTIEILGIAPTPPPSTIVETDQEEENTDSNEDSDTVVSNEILTTDPAEMPFSDSTRTQDIQSSSTNKPVNKLNFDYEIDRIPELEDANRNFLLAHSSATTSTSLASFSLTVSSTAEVSWSTGLFWNALDSFRDDANSSVTLDSIAVGTVGTATSGLIVGYVVWALRSGLMLSSLMTALPAWNLLDPLAIISVADSDRKQDEESLADIMETEKQKLANSEYETTKTNTHEVY